MGGIGAGEMVLVLLGMVLVIGLVGVSAFVIVRQALDRLTGHSTDHFESRVLDELEILRVRLDRISERLDAQMDPEIRTKEAPGLLLPLEGGEGEEG